MFRIYVNFILQSSEGGEGEEGEEDVGEEDEGEGDEGEGEEVDAALRAAVKQALGTAAVDSDDEVHVHNL